MLTTFSNQEMFGALKCNNIESGMALNATWSPVLANGMNLVQANGVQHGQHW